MRSAADLAVGSGSTKCYNPDEANHFQAIRFPKELYDAYLRNEAESTEPNVRDRLDGVRLKVGREIVTAANIYELATTPMPSEEWGHWGRPTVWPRVFSSS